MAEPTSCCTVPGSYCARVDTLFNLPGVHVTDVAWRPLATTRPANGCAEGRDRPGPGGLSRLRRGRGGHGRRVRRLHDIPAFGAPVELVWRVRRHRCQSRRARSRCSPRTTTSPGAGEADHPGGVVGDQLHQRDTASVAAVARRLGVDWHTVWDAIQPLL